jgi:hypothetical protein
MSAYVGESTSIYMGAERRKRIMRIFYLAGKHDKLSEYGHIITLYLSNGVKVIDQRIRMLEAEKFCELVESGVDSLDALIASQINPHEGIDNDRAKRGQYQRV